MCRAGVGTGHGAKTGGKHRATQKIPPASQAEQGAQTCPPATEALWGMSEMWCQNKAWSTGVVVQFSYMSYSSSSVVLRNLQHISCPKLFSPDKFIPPRNLKHFFVPPSGLLLLGNRQCKFVVLPQDYSSWVVDSAKFEASFCSPSGLLLLDGRQCEVWGAEVAGSTRCIWPITVSQLAYMYYYSKHGYKSNNCVNSSVIPKLCDIPLLYCTL